MARGIDIDDIEMVINYDVPHDTEDYVHRIGRTARANRDGRAITFVSEEDQYWFQQIEKFLEKGVDKMPLPEGCGEGPEYIKLNKPKKKGANGTQTTDDGNGGNGEPERTAPRTADRKTATRLLTSASRNKPNERQEKAPRSNEQQPSARQQAAERKAAATAGQQAAERKAAATAGQQAAERKAAEQKSQPSQASSQRTATARSAAITAITATQQRPGTENNVRPGSNGRGRGVAQKKGRKAGCTQAHPYRKSTEERKRCEEIHQAHLRIQEIGNKLSFKRKEE